MPKARSRRLRWILLLLAGSAEAVEMDWRPVPMANRPQFFYLPNGSLIDVYVMQPGLGADEGLGFDDGRHGWGTGIRYRMSPSLGMSLEARRQDDGLLRFDRDARTSWKMQMKPTGLRLGLSYRW